MTADTIIVAIDGPSGVGKSTVAKAVASRLGLPYLETGAMYRALGWKIYQERIDPEDRSRVEEAAGNLDLDLREAEDGSIEVLLGGHGLDAGVRQPRVSEITSLTSSYPAVRHRMVDLQRRFGRSRGAVMEGRDIGTRVFPDTPHKYFLMAPLAVRVERRIRQLEQSGRTDLSPAAIETEVAERDRRDSERQESPLKLDSSYTVIDTANLSADEAADLIVASVERSRRSPDDDC